MQYVTTAERVGIRIGMEKGETLGIKKGKLIGEILMAQRIIRHTSYSETELESRTLAELERIFAEVKARANRLSPHEWKKHLRERNL